MVVAFLAALLLVNVLIKPGVARPRPYVTLRDTPFWETYQAHWANAGSHLEDDLSFPLNGQYVERILSAAQSLSSQTAVLATGEPAVYGLDKTDRYLIMTSGENGLFPRGYVIGYVRSVQPDDSGMTAYAVIEPAEDLLHLDMVAAITGRALR